MNRKDILLPEGIYDLLPPMARRRTQLIQQLLDHFAAASYEQVNPPLVEFEDSLLAGRGTALATQTFRVMDPLSQRMLAFRPDMTHQVARIAATQMEAAPRPLRLCYAGTTLLASGDPLSPGRQKTQAGVEMFGSEQPQADSEVIKLAVSALEQVVTGDGGNDGIINIDLTLPGLVNTILDDVEIKNSHKARIKAAIARKDATCLDELPPRQADLLLRLIDAAGAAERALDIIDSLELPSATTAQIEHLHHVVEQLGACSLTIDPVEARGFEYHHLLSFSLFSRNYPHELGRGGRYRLENGEAAIGATLYVDTLLAGESL